MNIIPKIVHQIWIGPNTRPDIWMNSVRNFCNEFGYEYKLWTELEISKFPMINKSQYMNMKILCGKADIVRYEILNIYGGIYIDVDSVIINPIKLNELILNTTEDCAFGYAAGNQQIANGVILSVPQSFIMKECISRIPFRKLSLHPCLSTGPWLITEIYNENKDISIKLFPSDIFYPYGWHGITSVNQHEKMTFSEESVMFQYGYSTNYFQSKINQKPIYNLKQSLYRIFTTRS